VLIPEVAPRLLRSLILVVALFSMPALPLAQPPVSTPVPGPVIVEWTTESEVNQAGFNIYRSENPGGPYVKLNDSLIPASPDPVTGGEYSFTDTTAEAGVTYYYQLEDVELDGKTTMHGPIMMIADGNTATRWFQLGVPLAVALSATLGVGAFFVIKRQRQASRPPTPASGPDGEL